MRTNFKPLTKTLVSTFCFLFFGAILNTANAVATPCTYVVDGQSFSVCRIMSETCPQIGIVVYHCDYGLGTCDPDNQTFCDQY